MEPESQQQTAPSDISPGKENEGDLSYLRPGMTLRILTLDNRLIFVGRVESISAGTLQVSDDMGVRVPNIIYNTKVKLRGYHDKQSVTLEGSISGSTEQYWYIEHLRSLQGTEQREFFRQSSNLDAVVICANRIFGRQQQEISSMEGRPVPCRIVDLSAGGTMLRAKADFQEGDWLLLINMHIRLDMPPVSFTCVVRRVMEDEAGKKYGCEFYNLGDEEREELIQAIFQFQKKEIQEHRGDEI